MNKNEDQHHKKSFPGVKTGVSNRTNIWRQEKAVKLQGYGDTAT